MHSSCHSHQQPYFQICQMRLIYLCISDCRGHGSHKIWFVPEYIPTLGKRDTILCPRAIFLQIVKFLIMGQAFRTFYALFAIEILLAENKDERCSFCTIVYEGSTILL